MSVPTAISDRRIDDAVDKLSPSILGRSGAVFYTGREAFAGQRRLYLLGLNPGGDPIAQASETVARDIADYRARSEPWSAYADASWQGAAPGTWRMQPQVLHLLKRLEFDARTTPASNVVFVRTRNEAYLQVEKAQLLRECWPVHQAVIQALGVRVIVCFGGTAGKWVRRQLRASSFFGEFKETNNRGWRSVAHATSDGRAVVTVSHPSKAHWQNVDADPTPLVERALREAS